MALADFYLCDCCGSKTFYDANLNYDDWDDGDGAGQNPRTGRPWPNGNIGWMFVLCHECGPRFSDRILALEEEVEISDADL